MRIKKSLVQQSIDTRNKMYNFHKRIFWLTKELVIVKIGFFMNDTIKNSQILIWPKILIMSKNVA